MNHLSSETFRENAKAALADAQLRGALRNATSLFGERRNAAAASLPNWEALRTQARAIKDEALSQLDRYLDEFARNAESRGAKIHRAHDAAAANAIICKLAADHKARVIVKSKSMTTEETPFASSLCGTCRDVCPVKIDIPELLL